MISLSLQLMLYGLGGVFAALVILFFAVKIMTKILPYRDKEEQGPG